MGVTYKLKQEVVDFILGLKRADLNLSCRKISDLATVHFKKPISKSSVNAVLKTSSLSSPIGRRAVQEKKEEKFKIPEHRKKQIFTDVPKVVLHQDKKAPPAPQRVCEPKPVQPQLIDNMGVLFLKSAEWQIKSQGILRAIIEKFGPLPCDEKIFKLAEAFLVAPVFGEEGAERFVNSDNKNLWQISAVDFEPTVNQKKECLDILNGLKEKRGLIALERAQMFFETSHFSFLLQDGSGFAIDAQMNSCWPVDQVHHDLCLALDRSLETLSRCFIANRAPVILRCCSTERMPSESFLNMISAFENGPGKHIRAIALMAGKKGTVASFDAIVKKKRHYILGLPSTGFLKSGLASSQKDLPPVCCRLSGEAYHYQEAKTAFRLPDGQQCGANVYLLSREKNEPPFLALVTNIPAEIRSAENVIQDFLWRWPDPEKGNEYLYGQKEKTLNSRQEAVHVFDEKSAQPTGLKDCRDSDFAGQLCQALLLGLHDHLARHFFHPALRNIDFAEAQKKLYSLKGTVVKEKDFFKVALVLSESCGYAEEAAFFIGRLNEAGVVDPAGRRLFFDIAFSS